MLTETTGWATELERNDRPAEKLPMWRECFSALEAALLHIAPVYYGLGAPHGDGSPVVLIPGFLGTDAFLVELYAWLYRMDYKPYFSGIGINADCPNLLIKGTLNGTLDKARRETGKKVHIIGHSLGGMIAMSLGAQRPDDVASVIALAAPFRGKAAHPNILRMAEYVRGAIKARHGDGVLPTCYTGHCPCNFVDSLTRILPKSVMMTAVYTRTDAIVDWRYCVTGDPELDFEAPGTHIGMVCNPSVYAIIAKRLTAALQRR
jgi:pimeloyl-ACP methyl ester carboxylesterase